MSENDENNRAVSLGRSSLILRDHICSDPGAPGRFSGVFQFAISAYGDWSQASVVQAVICPATRIPPIKPPVRQRRMTHINT